MHVHIQPLRPAPVHGSAQLFPALSSDRKPIPEQGPVLYRGSETSLYTIMVTIVASYYGYNSVVL